MLDVNGQAVVARNLVEGAFDESEAPIAAQAAAGTVVMLGANGRLVQTEGAIDESEYPAAALEPQQIGRSYSITRVPGDDGAASIGKLPWQAPPKERIEQVSAEAKDEIDVLIAEIDGVITKEGAC